MSLSDFTGDLSIEDAVITVSPLLSAILDARGTRIDKNKIKDFVIGVETNTGISSNQLTFDKAKFETFFQMQIKEFSSNLVQSISDFEKRSVVQGAVEKVFQTYVELYTVETEEQRSLCISRIQNYLAGLQHIQTQLQCDYSKKIVTVCRLAAILAIKIAIMVA